MIRKHIFTVRWERRGWEAVPTFERYTFCDWPEDMPDNDALPAIGVLTGRDPHEYMTSLLPQDCKEALSVLAGMEVRCRYSNDTKGPYIIDDPESLFDEDLLLMVVAHASDKELDGYHMRRRKRV